MKGEIAGKFHLIDLGANHKDFIFNLSISATSEAINLLLINQRAI